MGQEVLLSKPCGVIFNASDIGTAIIWRRAQQPEIVAVLLVLSMTLLLEERVMQDCSRQATFAQTFICASSSQLTMLNMQLLVIFTLIIFQDMAAKACCCHAS